MGEMTKDALGKLMKTTKKKTLARIYRKVCMALGTEHRELCDLWPSTVVSL